MSSTTPLQDSIKSLPNKPGVYEFFNSEGIIIYVGKAKDLKKRVNSYFLKNPDANRKLHILVSKIQRVEHIVVESESDALLLENNLIKRHQPRYNILLKDDKTFPWIRVKKEPYPRVFSTRNLVQDGSLFFGPYTSGLMVKTLLELIRQLYPLRNCNLALTQENIQKGKFKVCLQYHIGNCKGPCVGEQEEDDYDKNIGQITRILKGNINEVLDFLREKMHSLAASYRYEDANAIKEKIILLEKYQGKSTIVNPSISNVDVYTIDNSTNLAFVNFLKVVNGAIVQAHTVEIKKQLDESSDEILTLVISDLRQRLGSQAPEIIVPFLPTVSLSNAKYTVPKIGDKKKLLDLSQRNVTYYRIERLRQHEKKDGLSRQTKVVEQMKKDLRLNSLPIHIECFDNSNLQGTNPVAACVVFRHGKPEKSDYRHYNVKTVVGPDDFASMREIIHRRYQRLLNEEKELPQLIVIDGGKGQLGAALESLRALELENKIAVIGIAKRLEEIYFPGDPIPLYLDKNSQTLKVLQHLRNEAHRFGITFHRSKRDKEMTRSELDQIPGIGENSVMDLLRAFGSVKAIQEAGIDQLKKIVGASRARKIYEYFRAKE